MGLGRLITGLALLLAAALGTSPTLAQTVTRYSFATTSGPSITGTFSLTNTAGTYTLSAYNSVAPNGYVFNLGNTGLQQANPVVIIGGTANGVTVVSANTDDFSFSFNPTAALPLTRPYSYATSAGAFQNPNISIMQAAAPEPVAWALMILGFGLVGGMLRRRRARSTAWGQFAFTT